MSRSEAILLAGYNRSELIELQLETLFEVEDNKALVSIDCGQLLMILK